MRNLSRYLSINRCTFWRSLHDGAEIRSLEYCLLNIVILFDMNFLKNLLNSDVSTFTNNDMVSSQKIRFLQRLKILKSEFMARHFQQ